MKTKLIYSLAIAMLLAGSLAAQKRSSGDREDRGVRSKSFTATKGGKLEVSVSVGDIRISPWEKNEVYISVDGIDEEDLDRLKMTQSGNSVRVTFRPKWNEDYHNVRFEVSVPSQFDIDMNTSGGDLEVTGLLTGRIEGQTSGGDIKLNSVAGTVDVSTSGGDVSAKDILGDGSLKTSGGDITLKKVSGQLEVATSGGNIKVESVSKTLNAHTSGGDIEVGEVGGEAKVSTSGGDVKMGKVSGRASMSTSGGNIELQGASGNVSARTSGGDIRLQNVTGTIDAKTSGGSVEAELIPTGKGPSKLVSSGGEIRLEVPENAKVTIEAYIRVRGWGRKRSDKYQVRSDFKADVYEKNDDEDEIRAVYKLNGGGDVITLETSDSDIEIRKMRAR
jgi:hypothetical protein